MTVPRKRGQAASLIKVVILAVIGAAVISGVVGYMIGMRSYQDQFSPTQVEFVDGIVAGTNYKRDLQEWEDDNSNNPADPRANPQVRCASDFFPNRPIAMQGCLAALNDRPEGGYQPKITR